MRYILLCNEADPPNLLSLFNANKVYKNRDDFGKPDARVKDLRPIFMSGSTRYMQKPPVFSPSRNVECLYLLPSTDKYTLHQGVFASVEGSRSLRTSC